MRDSDTKSRWEAMLLRPATWLGYFAILVLAFLCGYSWAALAHLGGR